MALKINTFAQIPIKVSLNDKTTTNFDLVISPLLPGYGHTFGNSIRRILLSSIPGSAVTRIRINELTHEYQTINGVVEDGMEVVLNLKQIRLVLPENEDKIVINYTSTNGGEIYVRDIFANSKLKPVNQDLYICTVNKGVNFEVELEFTKGSGYLSIEEINLVKNTNPHDLYVDAVFSPILNVSIDIEQVRVGDKTNYDQLTVTVDTDGTVESKNVVGFVFDTLIDQFTRVRSSFEASLGLGSKDFESPKLASLGQSQDTVSDEIDLPAKIKNILVKNNIHTNAELKNRVNEVEGFAGIAEASLLKVKTYVESIK
jgi:DNA-directed RNA polymerase subunit alpha